MGRNDLTAQRLREILHYEPESGVFTWLLMPRRSWVKPGATAGYINAAGYSIIKIAGLKYHAHRLVWLYMMGHWPSEEIDHIDHDKANNVLSNLRQATRKQNQENRRLVQDSISGYKGVTWDKLRGKWLARIKHNGQIKNLGRFDALDAAIAVRAAAEERLFTHASASSQLP